MRRSLPLAAGLAAWVVAWSACAQGILLQPTSTGAVFLAGTTAANSAAQFPQTSNSVNQWIETSAATGSAPSIFAGGASGDATEAAIFGTNGTGSLSFETAGSTIQFQVTHTASAVNNAQVTGSTGTNPILFTPVGTGGALGFLLAAKGAGTHYLGGTNSANSSVQVPTVASAVNQIVLTPAVSGSVPSITVGGSSGDANRNISVAGIGTGVVLLGQAICTISGASGQTCNGMRGIVTTNSLSTAASTAAAAYTINNSSVTAASLLECTINAYSGVVHTNGVPVITQCVPGAGTITVAISNIDTANALSGTVGIGFAVLN